MFGLKHLQIHNYWRKQTLQYIQNTLKNVNMCSPMIMMSYLYFKEHCHISQLEVGFLFSCLEMLFDASLSSRPIMIAVFACHLKMVGISCSFWSLRKSGNVWFLAQDKRNLFNGNVCVYVCRIHDPCSFLCNAISIKSSTCWSSY